MPRPLDQAVVVVTGASSGIGRATALGFARRGAALALCARGAGPLDEAAAECRAAGARQVLVRSLDVADEDAVEDLAAASERELGGLDVWVNCAATMAYGPFTEIPSEIYRGVVETDLIGTVNGARVALRRFGTQGRGVLINVSSPWGKVPSPLVSPYVISKNAVRALSECLRVELEAEPDIDVVLAIPGAAVDTPIFDNAANFSGSGVRPIPPMLGPERVAAAIVAGAERPRAKVSAGWAGRLLEALFAVSPTLYRRLFHNAFLRGTRSGVDGAPTPGNVLEPHGSHAVDGPWRSTRRPALRRAFIATTGGLLAGLFGSRAAILGRRAGGAAR